MDQRKALFSHEGKLGGLLSELQIEPRDEELPAPTVKNCSVRNVLSLVLNDAFEDEFFHWVATNANDASWVSWVSQRWQPVDAVEAANSSTA